MKKAMVYLSLLLIGCADAGKPAADAPAGDATTSPTQSTRIEVIDGEALNILDSSAAIETIAGGFSWTEGPLVLGNNEALLFSDIPNNRVYKWTEGDSVTLFLERSGYSGTVQGMKEPGSNALLLNPQGELVLLQHGDRRIVKMTASLQQPAALFTPLVERYEGKRLNSPNDGVYHSNGDLYFTDPPYGLDKRVDDPAKELPFQGVYRLKPNGKLDILTKELKYPNGIALSPDNKYLYVASSDAQNMIWMQYELDEKGFIKSGREFYAVHAYEGKEKGAPDGMKVNKNGYLFASGPEGVWIFHPSGKPVARIYTGHHTSNCAFSPDQKTLYMTCDDYVMRVRLK
ncbi:SMP-30/gluconolactonase/LRE family protein [Pseudoflavitalea sp. X16]|uniref:SMP-30/gluconolactonase/LRE family protein n=1 Tax=Paraflavitalea devenefica TaxID=2716334 RepID=UPI0014239B38|nr:SMP-30/gluconolactonase/LRE family protein [Paraflavitalea devenefica]NII27620.1 SMP-30/gluconolactonase/LRE family protein [Paraflavitalea devenefica]